MHFKLATICFALALPLTYALPPANAASSTDLPPAALVDPTNTTSPNDVWIPVNHSTVPPFQRRAFVKDLTSDGCPVPSEIKCETTAGSPTAADVREGMQWFTRTKPRLVCAQRNWHKSFCTTMEIGDSNKLDYPSGFPRSEKFNVEGNMARFSICNDGPNGGGLDWHWYPLYGYREDRWGWEMWCRDVARYIGYLLDTCTVDIGGEERVGGIVKLTGPDVRVGEEHCFEKHRFDIRISTAKRAAGPP